MRSTGINPDKFKHLPLDGARFEALVCQLLEAMGYRILEKPAVGTEGGRDVLVERILKDVMGERREKVVVQCKHYAQSGKAIGDKDIGVWENAMKRYRARGYLLVTDTRVTENLSKSFREFTEDEANIPKWAAFWDVDDIISHLNEYPNIRNTFFPPTSLALTPLQDLAGEVRTWLESIRYRVSDPQTQDARTIDMIAVLDQGTIKQQILIRCIGGEISPSDIDKLDAKLTRKIPQGWLISDKRVSEQARKRVDKDGTIKIFNLSEILQTMIWGPYFGALTDLIEAGRIPDLYVDLECYKLGMNEEGNVLDKDKHTSLDSYIDEWLAERGKMHISLLGEFGAGKTWFCRHYAYRQLDRFLKNPAHERLPLLITLRMFSKATTAQQIINDAFLEQYKLPFIGSAYDVFQYMNVSGKLLLILDGFDEMARKVDYQTVVDNFWELAKLVEEGSKVILTSRTEYFRWAKESEKIFGGEEFGRSTIVLQPPKFEVVYLEPFTDEQVREVIIKRVGPAQGTSIADRIMGSENLAEMARKPILLELLLAALDEVSPDVLENPTQVYLYATNKLLLRNISAEKTFTSTADKLYFLCELAWEMINSNQLRIHYIEIPERIKTYFGHRIKDQHELDTWDYDLRAQTLLHRDAAGYYEFAHKSLAEYFVALKLAAQTGCLDPTFTSAYSEADGKPCELSLLKPSPDFSDLPLPRINYAIATFFADMAGDKLSIALPSYKDAGLKAVEFRKVRASLMKAFKIKGHIDVINIPNAALGAVARIMGAKTYTLSIAFGNELVAGMVGPKAASTPYRQRLRMDESLSGHAALTGSTYVADDINADPMYRDNDSASRDVKSMLVSPLIYKEHLIGVWSFAYDKPRQFSKADISEIEAVGRGLAQYIALLGQFKEAWQVMPNSERYILVISLCL